MSRSDLLRAVNQVRITAAESMANLTPGNASPILTSIDEHGNKSVTKIAAFGNLIKEQMSLKIDHLASALEALSDELLIMKVCQSVVELFDEKGWEIIGRIEPEVGLL